MSVLIYPLWFERAEAEREWWLAPVNVGIPPIVVTLILSAWNCFHPWGRRGDGWCKSWSIIFCWIKWTRTRRWYYWEAVALNRRGSGWLLRCGFYPLKIFAVAFTHILQKGTIILYFLCEWPNFLRGTRKWESQLHRFIGSQTSFPVRRWVIQLQFIMCFWRCMITQSRGTL